VSALTAPLPLAGNLYDCMEKAASFGYRGVEFHTRETFEPDFDRIRQIEKSLGTKICCVVSGRMYTQGKHGLLDDDPESEQAAVSGMKQYIDMAHSLDGDMIIGWAKGVVPPDGDRKLYLKRLAQHLKELNAYSKTKGVRLMLEVINHYETNIFNTTRETLDFIGEHGLDRCYVHLDTYHMGLEEYDPYAAIRLCGKKLGYFHVADNSRRYPGSGQFDFKRMLSTLDDIEYDGWVTVECLPYPDRDTAAKKAITYLKACELARFNEV
jgi:sugar phosphate isomerase/epimerase